MRVKQQLNAIKNFTNQIDIFQKQFIHDSQKRPEQTNDEQTDKETLNEGYISIFIKNWKLILSYFNITG